MWQFNEGLLAVCVDGKWGYIDRAGHFAIKPTFVYASNFHDGRAIVKNKGSAGYAYMDKSWIRTEWTENRLQERSDQQQDSAT
jgi:WG containing repeat